MRSPLAALLAFAFVTSLLVVVPATEAQSGAPANCSAANLNLWFGYQYNQQVKSTWDSYTAQSLGVCVMRDAQTPIPGACRFSVERPWYTASGSPPSPPLCWWGTRSVPQVSLSAPAGCFPTSLSARPAYGNAAVKATWDHYSSQTLGVCESIGQTPGDCKFMVQEAGNKWLCWWPARSSSGLVQLLDRSAYETMSRTAIGMEAVCDFVGTGRSIVEFRVGDDRVQVLVEGCQVKDIQWLTPPNGCDEVDPQAFASIVGQAAIDAGNADSAGVCRIHRTAQTGECSTAIPLTASSTLCFWGRRTGGPRVTAAFASFTGSTRFFIDMSEAAMRTILNSGDLGEVTKDLLCKGYVAFNADKPADKVKLRAAQSTLLEDRLCSEPAPQPTEVSMDGHLGLIKWGDTFGLGELPNSLLLVTPEGGVVGDLPVLSVEEAYGDPNDPMVRDTIYLEAMIDAHAAGFTQAQIDAALGGKGIGADLSEILNLGTRLRDLYLNPPPTGPDPFRGTLHIEVFGTGANQIIISPPAAPEDEGESILDDVSECRVICSLPPGSGAFQPGGAAYLGGANAGLDARLSLEAAGLGGFA